MTKKKIFDQMENAIYELHQILVSMKKAIKSAGNSQDAKDRIERQYANLIEHGSEKVGKCTAEWLSVLKEDSSTRTS